MYSILLYIYYYIIKVLLYSKGNIYKYNKGIFISMFFVFIKLYKFIIYFLYNIVFLSRYKIYLSYSGYVVSNDSFDI